ncbi:MAG TPA: ATP-binding protein [Burkholderiaceae bacterium]|nr:ATP-binding protein [Burkholderiaceae bacterium]
MTPELERRLADLLARLEPLLPAASVAPDWSACAFRWRRQRLLGVERGVLEAVTRVARIAPADLQHVEAQKAALLRNTEQFVRGLPANNVLLTGARGTGKSSLVRACLERHAADGLRLIEVDKHDLGDVDSIAALVAGRPERFILFCDDLSFEAGEAGYKALKAALDGSVAAPGDNVLIYATSNRRHLMPEAMRDNLAAKYDEDGELHPGEAVEEKISLSERFGLWLSFYPFRQDDYLDIVAHWLRRFGVGEAEIAAARAEALQFALQRGSRSGRVALQFARDQAGRLGLAG